MLVVDSVWWKMNRKSMIAEDDFFCIFKGTVRACSVVTADCKDVICCLPETRVVLPSGFVYHDCRIAVLVVHAMFPLYRDI